MYLNQFIEYHRTRADPCNLGNRFTQADPYSKEGPDLGSRSCEHRCHKLAPRCLVKGEAKGRFFARRDSEASGNV